MFDDVSVRSRKIRIGRSGAFERSSITMNAAISAAAPASRPIVDAVPQPCWVARVIAYTSSMRPPVIDVAPAASKWRDGRERARAAPHAPAGGHAPAAAGAWG